MLWQNHFTEEFLFNSSTEYLISKRKELQLELEQLTAEYSEKQNAVIERLDPKLNWFLNNNPHIKKPDEIVRKVNLFKRKLHAAKDVDQLAAVIRQEIEPFSKLEKTFGIAKEDSLSDRLSEEYETLCFEGLLPRIFSEQVRPKILTEMSSLRLSFIEESATAFSSHTENQIKILRDLEERLAGAPTEELAKEYIKEAIQHAENLVMQEKRKTSTVFYFSMRLVGVENNQKLREKLIAFHQSLASKRYLTLPSQFSIKWQSLQEAICRLDTQIGMNNLAAEEQKEKCVKSHQRAFDLVSAHAFSQYCDIGRYLTVQQQYFVTIPNRVDITKKDAIKNLNKKYSEFWKGLAKKTGYHAYSVKNQQSNDWRLVHKNVSKARELLQVEGRLTSSFVEDKRHIIIRKFDEHIKKAYKRAIIQKGDERDAELQHVRALLCGAASPEEVSKIIYGNADDIDQNHKLYSFSYNFVPLRKESRAAKALRDLATECEAEGLLPHQQPIIPSDLYKRIRKAETDYFSQDVIYSSTSSRYITITLLRFIQLIEARVIAGDLEKNDADQIIADGIEHAIDKAKRLEDSNGFGKISTFFSGKIGLNTALTEARNQLNQAKIIPISYQRITFPRILQKLTEAQHSYNNNTNISDEELANNGKEEGLNAVGQMIGRLRNAINREQAQQLLRWFIRSCEKDKSPILAETVRNALNDLVIEGVLDLSVSDLTDEAIRVKEQHDKIAQEIAKEADHLAKLANCMKGNASPPRTQKAQVIR